MPKLSDCANKLDPLEDSVGRRDKLVALEEESRSLWRSAGYHPVESDDVVNNILESLGNPAEFKFTNMKRWFGGLWDDGVDHSAENALPYFCTLWSLMAASNDLESRRPILESVCSRMGEYFQKRSSLVDMLMENDERLLHSLLALLEVEGRGIVLPSLLQPLPLFLVLLLKIDFSEGIFVDWLLSESVAIPFIVRFFKQLLVEYPKIRQIITTLKIEESENEEMETEQPATPNVFWSSKKSARPIRLRHKSSANPDDYLKITAVEYHGDQRVRVEHRIPRRSMTEVCSDDGEAEPFPEVDEFIGSMSGCVSRLLSRVQSADSKNLLPFSAKALVSLLRRVDSLSD